MSDYEYEATQYEDGWQAGYGLASDDAAETIAEKDAFIEEQVGIITQLIRVVDIYDAWGGVSEELTEKLRSYV